MKHTGLYIFIFTIFFSLKGNAQEYFDNPILSGFNPDPSICRVNEDYYMVTSSFTWFPGIPIYHSKDLVNWELIGHGLSNPNIINMNGIDDNNGIWAVTIRYHEGLFYLITTASKCGGNFYITASNPEGPWSEPVWLKDATGIDPSLFWDTDGKCYYTGNSWDFPKSWQAQCATWIQELDLKQKKLIGKRQILAYGHANNATYAEGPHLYKINGKYLLLMAEGGSSYYHAITAHQSSSVWGPYIACKVNPVLTHRHLGNKFPIQNVGHADLVQTQNGDWYAVALGIRIIDGLDPLARESFLCKVDFEESTPIFNAGYGMIRPRQERPNLPWTPTKNEPDKDDFLSDTLSPIWHFVRIPQSKFYSISSGNLNISLKPEAIDSLVNSAMIIRKTKCHYFTATTKMKFQPKKENEEAGIVLYRTTNGYYALMKNKSGIVLIKKHLGKKEIIKQLPYNQSNVYLSIEINGIHAEFKFGSSLENMTSIGDSQYLDAISDNKLNKFNGTGIGVYATSNGLPSKNIATYDWFEYHPYK